MVSLILSLTALNASQLSVMSVSLAVMYLCQQWRFLLVHLWFRSNGVLGDLAIVIETEENAVQTNQDSTLLFDWWPRTIAKTIATATRFMRFSLTNWFVHVITLL